MANQRNEMKKTVRQITENLKKMGLRSAIAEVSEDGKTAYILFDKNDLINYIEKKVRKRLKKDIGGRCKVSVGSKEDIMFIKVSVK